MSEKVTRPAVDVGGTFTDGVPEAGAFAPRPGFLTIQKENEK